MNVRLAAVAVFLVFTNALLPHAAGARPMQVSLGVTVGTTLPREATKVRVQREIFFVYHGSFYRPVRQGFVLVAPPVGAQVNQLPRGAAEVTVGGATYHYHAGAWYRALRRGFEVCASPITDAGTTAPRVIAARLGNEQFQFRAGTFFQDSPDGLLARGAPLGAVTNEFPPDGVSVWYGDSEYFESHGVFFRDTGAGFKVVPAPWSTPLLADG